MADEHKEDAVGESSVEKITEKPREEHSSSSSSDSDDEKTAPSSFKSSVYRLFGRQRPVHKVFGGGKRTAKISAPRLDFSVSYCSDSYS